MTHQTKPQDQKRISQRKKIGDTVAAVTTANLTLGGKLVMASTAPKNGENQMTPEAFVYTELQISVPFADVPWQDLNDQIDNEPGFLNKTWFSGVGNNSVGGIYSFDSVEAAQHYCTTFFPAAAKAFGVAQTTRVFDAAVVSDASRDMGSPHFGAAPTQAPGAFVYTEVQINVPFEKAPWQARNPVLKQQKGLISKLWLSGLNTNTLGGVDAFDTVENARAFAVDDFPNTAAKLNAAFYTRVFDASIAEAASRGLHSPYYT
ncbi:YdhR family protein [Pseudohalocynthiibacter aestuariivivens]|uniref:YdhR family protein n=1 Tax=Pseudohalocynthiibacter aestuariivivens TaxID=1591409 RepID=A0ABV5JBV6_9RHOB|nr:YdhR family protein [Pseudohalocynthiibacter aestuariivivens]MBS9718638.1 YdhR family protein [Pseudohalocynthiibacter aestuariivivens]